MFDPYKDYEMTVIIFSIIERIHILQNFWRREARSFLSIAPTIEIVLCGFRGEICYRFESIYHLYFCESIALKFIGLLDEDAFFNQLGVQVSDLNELSHLKDEGNCVLQANGLLVSEWFKEPPFREPHSLHEGVQVSKRRLGRFDIDISVNCTELSLLLLLRLLPSLSL